MSVYFARPPPRASTLLAQQNLCDERTARLSNASFSLDERCKAAHESALASDFLTHLIQAFDGPGKPVVITDVRVLITAYGDAYPASDVCSVLARWRGKATRWYREVTFTRQATIEYYGP